MSRNIHKNIFVLIRDFCSTFNISFIKKTPAGTKLKAGIKLEKKI
jgi:hypothetical protein